jgi:serine/threonine protein kinase
VADGETQAPGGGWTLAEVVGRGSHGVVYRCTRAGRPGVYALKRVPLAPDLRPRFLREVEALRALSHPGIVRLHDAGADADSGWFVMDLVPGVPLLACRARPPLPAPVVLGIARAVADALAHAHAHGVFHRDLKPANVIVAPDGRPVVVDFGVALVADRARLSRAGPGPATPPYAPPEWFDRRGTPGLASATDAAAADVYALGVLVAELLDGAPAFPRCGLDALARAKATTPRLAMQRAPAEIRDLLERATARAADRPAMGALAAALGAWPPAPLPVDPTVSRLPGEGPPEPPATDPSLGRYRIEAVIGRGGAGVVYRAWDPLLARHVAIKRLSAPDPDAVARFTREARLVAGLHHPGVVGILDFGEDDRGGYYAMELVDGPDLRSRAQAGPVPIDDAVRWVRAAAEALAAAHAAGVVHRDVKPANLLLDGDTVRLTDFGLALDPNASRVTGTGQLLGSPMYMAPEQALGRTADARTDVYGLGVVLYELVAGRPPYPSEHPAAVLRRILEEDLPPLPARVPAPLARIVATATARAPDDRYATMAAFAADLDRFFAGVPVLARRRWTLRPLARLSRGVAVAVGLGALGFTGWASWRAWVQASLERAAATHRASTEQAVVRAEAEGRIDEADAAFLAFAQLPEHAGTRALAEAWLAHADRLARRGDAAGAAEARARAWLVAERPAEQEAALLALGGQFLEDWDWHGLAGVVAALDGLGAERGADLRIASTTSRRDLRGHGPELRPLVDRLGRATRLGWTASDPQPLRGDSDGDAWWVLRDGQLAHLAPDARLQGPPVPVPGMPTDWHWFRVFEADGQSMAFGCPERGGTASLWQVSADGPGAELARWQTSVILDAWAGDLRGDGVTELYYGTGAWERDLWRLRPDGSGRWVRTDAHPPTSDANSDVIAVLGADLDGDGRASLLVKTSAWGGFDVRELRSDGDGGLALTARRKLGEGWNLRRVRGPTGLRLAASALGGGGSREQWPPGKDGEARGIHLLRPDLSTDLVLPLPRGRSCTTVYAGDIDGDGADDLGVGCGDDTMLARQLADGSFAPLWLANTVLHGIIDFDDDGADEVRVAVRTPGRPDLDVHWVAGIGDGSLPPGELPPPGAAPPPGTDRSLASAWRRAEALVAMGLSAQARRRLEEIATLDATGPTGAAALVRAADLAVRERDHATAARLYARAADRPEVAVRGALGAADAWAADHRFGPAVDALDRWLGAPESAGDPRERARRAEQRAAWGALASSPVHEPQPTDWILDDPLQISVSVAPGGGLRVDATDRGAVARLPVTLGADRAGFEVEVDLIRAEWGTSLDLGLFRPGATEGEWVVRVQARGGGGSVGTVVQLGDRVWVCELPREGPAWGDRLNLRFDYLRPTGAVLVSVDGLPAPCVTRTAGPPVDLSGPWELRLGSFARPADERTLVSARVRRVRLSGARPASQPAGVYGAVEPWSAVVRLEALDRWAEAEAALRDAIRAEPPASRARRIAWLLRTHPRLVPVIRDALGAGWGEAFLETWVGVFGQHPEDPLGHTALTAQLGPLPDGTPDAVVLELESLRARAWRLLGRTDRARLAADAAVALARAHPDTEGTPFTSAVTALREAAAARVDTEPEVAIALLEEALGRSPSPEVAADALVIDPAFAPLRGLPGWAAIDAARRSAFPR